MGSARHADGACTPCAHNWKSGSCYKGKGCTFCHLCGEKEYRRCRKDKVQRDRRYRKEKLRSNPGSASEVRSDVPNPPVLFDTPLLEVRHTFVHVSSVVPTLKRTASSPAVLQSGELPQALGLKYVAADNHMVDIDSDDVFSPHLSVKQVQGMPGHRMLVVAPAAPEPADQAGRCTWGPRALPYCFECLPHSGFDGRPPMRLPSPR